MKSGSKDPYYHHEFLNRFCLMAAARGLRKREIESGAVWLLSSSSRVSIQSMQSFYIWMDEKSRPLMEPVLGCFLFCDMILGFEKENFSLGLIAVHHCKCRCGYAMTGNGTFTTTSVPLSANPDCTTYSNDDSTKCYDCDSCK